MAGFQLIIFFINNYMNQHYESDWLVFAVTPMHTVDSLIKRYDKAPSEGPGDRNKSPGVEEMTNK